MASNEKIGESRESLKLRFEAGDKPTQEDFAALIDSVFILSGDVFRTPANAKEPFEIYESEKQIYFRLREIEKDYSSKDWDFKHEKKDSEENILVIAPAADVKTGDPKPVVRIDALLRVDDLDTKNWNPVNIKAVTLEISETSTLIGQVQVGTVSSPPAEALLVVGGPTVLQDTLSVTGTSTLTDQVRVGGFSGATTAALAIGGAQSLAASGSSVLTGQVRVGGFSGATTAALAVGGAQSLTASGSSVLTGQVRVGGFSGATTAALADQGFVQVGYWTITESGNDLQIDTTNTSTSTLHIGNGSPPEPNLVLHGTFSIGGSPTISSITTTDWGNSSDNATLATTAAVSAYVATHNGGGGMNPVVETITVNTWSHLLGDVTVGTIGGTAAKLEVTGETTLRNRLTVLNTPVNGIPAPNLLQTTGRANATSPGNVTIGETAAPTQLFVKGDMIIWNTVFNSETEQALLQVTRRTATTPGSVSVLNTPGTESAVPKLLTVTGRSGTSKGMVSVGSSSPDVPADLTVFGNLIVRDWTFNKITNRFEIKPTTTNETLHVGSNVSGSSVTANLWVHGSLQLQNSSPDNVNGGVSVHTIKDGTSTSSKVLLTESAVGEAINNAMAIAANLGADAVPAGTIWLTKAPAELPPVGVPLPAPEGWLACDIFNADLNLTANFLYGTPGNPATLKAYYIVKTA